MNIFVTGATGFIGRRLTAGVKSALLSYTGLPVVRILFRKPHPDYQTVVCDHQSEPIPDSALDGIDTVFLLAGFAHDLRDNSKVENLYRAVNVNATVQLVELAVQQGVQRFIFVSSVKAGGHAIAGHCMTEENQGEPEGIYGKTKR